MKPISTLCILPILSAIAAAQVPAAPRAMSQMRDAATHDQIAPVYLTAEKQNPMLKLPPAKGPDPSTVNQPKDIISQSDFICFNGTATLVPKNAIMIVPKTLAARLKYQPGSKFESWTDFFAKNRGWITTVEVTRVQAEGNALLPETTTTHLARTGNLVVATHGGCPISVLPPKQVELPAPAAAITSR